MKPLSIVLLCLFVMAPFLLMMEVRCDSLAAAQSLRAHYDTVLDNAISDAAQQLAIQTTGAGYGEEHGMEIEANLAVEIFFSSLCSGLGAQSQYAQDRLRERVPVVVVALGDQTLLYLVQKTGNQSSGSGYRHACVRMVPYTQTGSDTEPLVLYSLGPEVRVLNRVTGQAALGEWHQFDAEGLLHEANGPTHLSMEKPKLFETETIFSANRLRAVRDAVTFQLETGVQVSAASGATATLNLPAIKDASFRNAVTGVGLFAFVKGLPIGSQQEYQTLAFGGGRVVHRNPVTGWEYNEQQRYCASDCQLLLEALSEADFATDGLRYFSNSQEAAMEGYMPCSHCRP